MGEGDKEVGVGELQRLLKQIAELPHNVEGVGGGIQLFPAGSRPELRANCREFRGQRANSQLGAASTQLQQTERNGASEISASLRRTGCSTPPSLRGD